MTTYAGYEVLDLAPNQTDPLTDSVAQGRIRLANETGISFYDETTSVPSLTRAILWTCVGYDAIRALYAFLDRRQGRVVPFWIPTWRRDVSLVATAQITASLAKIARTGYANTLFPDSGARRHFMFYAPGQDPEFKKATNATDVPLSGWETITFSSAFSSDWTAASLVSFLRLARLANDLTSIRYIAQDIAQATIEMVELPMEAPL